jgi:hypothetical protein
MLDLQTQPQVWFGLKGFGKAQGHVGGDSSFAVQNTRESGAGDGQMARDFSYAMAGDIAGEDSSGMRWVVHLHDWLLSVVILVMDEDGVFALIGYFKRVEECGGRR